MKHRKLTYIANARIPTEKANGVQITKMCEAFADVGMKVELILPRRIEHEDLYKKANPFDYYKTKRNFKIKKVFTVDLMSLESIWVSFGKLAFLIQDLTFSLAAAFISFRTQGIIYTRSKSSSFLNSLFTKKVVYESHSRAQYKWLDRFVAKKAFAVVAITKSIENSWKKLGATTIYAPDGVSAEFFKKISKKKTRRELKLPENKVLIAYIGNLVTMEKEKGIKTLLLATKLFKREKQNIVCCIVGGPKRWEVIYQEYSRKHDLSREVIFTGHVPFDQIPQYLQAMDILVIPFPNKPHFAYNASPLKLFEYMASNKPIVASDLSSIREVLSEKNSILVEPDNPQALKDGIKKVISDPILSKKLAQSAQKEARKYTWKRRVEKISANFK